TGLLDAINENKPADYTEDDVKWYEKAIYYTYSFHDDDAYMRYDETLDTDETGDRYTEYKQSDYSETVAYLYYEDYVSDDTELTYSTFLDFSPVDVTVTPSETDSDDTTGDTETTTDPTYNVWLLFSSIALAVVLFAVLAIIVVRKIVKRVKAHKIHANNLYVKK
ncbi:MAG: hypothetical protein ACI4U2_03855, partial [Christensenellaceae bacterium]